MSRSCCNQVPLISKRRGGIFEPADLALLQRVFDQLYIERRLDQKDKQQREAFAEEIVSVFQSALVETALVRCRSTSDVLAGVISGEPSMRFFSCPPSVRR
jgi:hypothetical protein